MATHNILSTPEFISDTKSFETYKKDLKRWAKFTTIEKKNQAEWIVMHLESHPSGIKEKIDTQIADKIEDSEQGIDTLLDFLEKIYKKDDFSEAYNNFITFEVIERKSGENITDFITRWEQAVAKIKKMDCDISDKVKAFKLLKAAKVTQIERQLVIGGVNYEDGKTKKDLETQTKNSLKKFIGRSVLDDIEEEDEKTYVTREELTFF